ncbi:GPI ethanolamine phosphate transferase 2 [Trichoplax sp. H2]|nr:GPI ethanolamine phosphate transferase 2 [Trichoplax sp. H2]|eukprot:RDD42235.1 GPI ethanolamine phosphate transferase 2 [Trichoplax sp. H2]
MDLDRHKLFLLILVVYHLVAIGLFAKGYFPIKTNAAGYSTLVTTPPEPYKPARCDGVWCGSNYTIPPQFGRLVIMVIDALRADFILSQTQRMQFVEQLINSRQALAYPVKTHTPTVTTPRIKLLTGKSMTSGSIPGFSDFFGNMASTSLNDDNILSQFLRAKWNITFFGDDTWVKLFPKHFLRKDGVISFFVSDFYEVDNNVTRHVRPELGRKDWQVMILHYLGLDHIGHTARPSSPLVVPKLKEMDDIVKVIYNALEDQDKHTKLPSLFVLCGDHGMSDTGSHGGASYAEIMTPFVFMSPTFAGKSLPSSPKSNTVDKLLQKQVNQIDFVPTISTLFGFPIPKNNLGVVINELTSVNYEDDLESLRYKLRSLQLNIDQLMVICKKNIPSDSLWRHYQHIQQSHSDWLREYHRSNHSNSNHLIVKAEHIINLYSDQLHAVSDRLVASLSNYDLYTMAIGLLLQFEVYFFLLYGFIHFQLFRSFPQTLPIEKLTSTVAGFIFFICSSLIMLIHLVLCTGLNFTKSALCSTSVIESVCVLITVCGFGYGIANFLCCLSSAAVLAKDFKRMVIDFCRLDTAFQFLIISIIFHTFTLFSSSFIEEEHQTWYYICPTFFAMLSLSFLRQYFSETRWGENVIAKASSRTIPSRSGTRRIRKIVSSSHYDQTAHSGPVFHQDRMGMAANLTNFEDQRLQSFVSTSDFDDSTTTDKVSIWQAKKEILCSTCILACSRLIRSWNRTGDKWSHLPDVGDWLNLPDNKVILSITSLLSLLAIHILRTTCHTKFEQVIIACGLLCCYAYRAALGTTILPIPLSNMLRISSLLVACAHYSIGQACYFALGNSNSLATVDISAGFVGLRGHNDIAMVILTFVGTYTGQLIGAMSFIIYSLKQSNSYLNLWQYCGVLLLSRSQIISFYYLLVDVMRYHPFSWSVFLPKLMYEGATSIVYCLLITIILFSIGKVQNFEYSIKT